MTIAERLVEQYRHGPGTELKKLLAGMGVESSNGCDCGAMLIKMNSEGAAWCRRNLDLIAGHLEAEGRKRGWKLPLMRFGAKTLIRLAIWKAKVH